MHSSPRGPPRDPVVDTEATVRLTPDLVRGRTVSETGAQDVEGPATGLLSRGCSPSSAGSRR
jgi:succinyl-diaminopimelate desuccinylase